MEWQPIETAPKGNSENVLILSWGDIEDYDASITVGFWGSIDSLGGEQFDWLDWCRGIDPDENWYVVDRPTHWMPLPDPPV